MTEAPGVPPARGPAPRLERPERQWLQLWLVREREFFREPGVLFWVFGFPLLIAIALGLAFGSRGPETFAVVVADDLVFDTWGADPVERRFTNSREIAQALSESATLEVAQVPHAEALHRLHHGDALLLVMPGGPPTIRYDPSRPGAAAAAAIVREALERARGRKDIVAPREEMVSAPGKRYIDFLIPGLLGMSLMSGGIWGVGWALVTMRIRKLLKRLAATPMSRPAFLLSFGLHRLVVAVVETVILLVFGLLAFGVEIRGSILDFAVVALSGTVAFAAMGLLIATRAQNAETASGLINLATLPMWIVSGVFFSASNFPSWMRPAVDALPLTALNDALRAVMNDAEGLSACAGYLGILAAWTVGCFVLALRWFRWQ